MLQVEVGKDEGCHAFDNHGSADGNTRIVPSLGGISNGEPIYCRMAFKPTATISQLQKTAGRGYENGELAARGRHDPCVAVRAPVIVESMAALVLADLYLQQKRNCL